MYTIFEYDIAVACSPARLSVYPRLHQGWLDDFPSAGWAYGALTNNRTGDFLALLYGHMATYTSRGSFHATEELDFRGEGAYRSFLGQDASGGGGAEVDVSLCVVTAVLVARLTRWQLVFEPYRSSRCVCP